jgi:hypothetical protein
VRYLGFGAVISNTKFQAWISTSKTGATVLQARGSQIPRGDPVDIYKLTN